MRISIFPKEKERKRAYILYVNVKLTPQLEKLLLDKVKKDLLSIVSRYHEPSVVESLSSKKFSDLIKWIATIVYNKRDFFVSLRRALHSLYRAYVDAYRNKAFISDDRFEFTVYKVPVEVDSKIDYGLSLRQHDELGKIIKKGVPFKNLLNKLRLLFHTVVISRDCISDYYNDLDMISLNIRRGSYKQYRYRGV